MPTKRPHPSPRKVEAPIFWNAGRYAVEERLPMPAVDYWKPYAPFLGFAPTLEGPYALCECARGALANAIRFERIPWDRDGQAVNQAKRVPTWASSTAFSHLPEDIETATECFRFAPEVCHRCNLVAPERRYCDPMYGGSFKQGYGWYFSQNHFRFGVATTSLRWLPDLVPPELAHLLVSVPTSGLLSGGIRIASGDKIRRDVERFVENSTRAEFGIFPIGEGWVSESLLAKIVAQVFFGEDLIRHLRPDWLEGLELDIWLPGRKLAIEYQGQQHFHPIEAWGGTDALTALQARDVRKAELCTALGIRLVAVDYTEPLTEAHVASRLTGS